MQNKTLFELRGLETSCAKVPYLRKLCRYAGGHVNAILLMHIDWDRYTLLTYKEIGFKRPKADTDYSMRLQDQIARGIQVVREKGLDFYLWWHELKLPPGFLKQKGADFLDPEKPDMWDLIRWKLGAVLDLYPELKGIVFTSMGESMPDTGVLVSQIRSRTSTGERLSRLFKVVKDVCDAHGKQLIIRNHGAGLSGHDTFLRALGRLDGGFRLMGKGVEPDVQPPYPHNAWIRAMARKHPTVMELTCCQEYTGVSYTPYCFPAEIKSRIHHALETGCCGIVARADWREAGHQVELTHPLLGRVNEVNLYAFCRLVNDPHVPLQRLWREWAEQRYGKRAALNVVKALWPTFDSGSKRCYSMGCRGITPSATSGSLLHPRAALSLYMRDNQNRFAPSPLNLYWLEAFSRPDEELIDLVVQEKDAAIRQNRRALKWIEKAHDCLPRREKAQLTSAFRLAISETEIIRDYARLFFNMLAYEDLKQAGRQHRARAQKALDAIEAKLDRFQRAYRFPGGPGAVDFVSPARRAVDQARQYLRRIDGIVEQNVKWDGAHPGVTVQENDLEIELANEAFAFRFSKALCELSRIERAERGVRLFRPKAATAGSLFRHTIGGNSFGNREGEQFLRSCVYESREAKTLEIMMLGKAGASFFRIALSDAHPCAVLELEFPEIRRECEIEFPRFHAEGRIRPARPREVAVLKAQLSASLSERVLDGARIAQGSAPVCMAPLETGKDTCLERRAAGFGFQCRCSGDVALAVVLGAIDRDKAQDADA